MVAGVPLYHGVLILDVLMLDLEASNTEIMLSIQEDVGYEECEEDAGLL